MKSRTIGNTSLASGALGLGCNKMLDAGNADLVRTANAAIDAGIVHFDGADSYGEGKCEIFFSKVLNPRRSEVTEIGRAHV